MGTTQTTKTSRSSKFWFSGRVTKTPYVTTYNIQETDRSEEDAFKNLLTGVRDEQGVSPIGTQRVRTDMRVSTVSPITSLAPFDRLSLTNRSIKHKVRIEH